MTEAPTRAPFTERRVRIADDATMLNWGIAVEAAVEININGSPWTVMMATPADLEDLALGLALTEQVISDPRAVESITIANYLDGIAVDVRVAAAAVNDAARRARSLEGRVGCGLCGVEALASLPRRRSASVGERIQIDVHAVRTAFDALAAVQPLNRATHSVHAAAWCRTEGAIDLVREDVGRHNALDKVVGALARGARLDEPGFIVMTSRCSFELVYKTAATRAGVLATISAPTSLALDWAATLRLPLLCRGRDGQVIEFPGGPDAA
jgi:formate dehydrogenase accessory protein FdhD